MMAEGKGKSAVTVGRLAALYRTVNRNIQRWNGDSEKFDVANKRNFGNS